MMNVRKLMSKIGQSEPSEKDEPQLIVSGSTTITSSTSDSLAFVIGNDTIGQTFTSADPRVLRVEIEVTRVNSGEQFVLDYDGTCTSNQCSSLDTPVVVVPEGVLPFIAIAVLIPIVMGSSRRKDWMKLMRERFRIIRSRCGKNLARSKGYVRQRNMQSARDELASE